MASRNETLSTAKFNKLCRLVYDECGITLGAEKKTMVELRIKRRIQSLQLTSYDEYCDLVAEPENDDELVHLIDAITTNKTDFFRESGHFEYLVSRALPDLIGRYGLSHKFLVWSAGCSTGEEPYTLAMVLSEFAAAHPNFRFSILATDICTEVLEKARLGIYKSEVATPVPKALLRKYFMRSRDPKAGLLRVVPELRELVEFRHLNFMDVDFGLVDAPEIIFCRNVIIYFDRPTQTQVLKKLTSHLAPEGYFFTGHSESLQGMNLPLVSAGLAVYRKPA